MFLSLLGWFYHIIHNSLFCLNGANNRRTKKEICETSTKWEYKEVMTVLALYLVSKQWPLMPVPCFHEGYCEDQQLLRGQVEA